VIEKIVVFAPMPIARESAAVTAKRGLRLSNLIA
jgi:hypothetical protein